MQSLVAYRNAAALARPLRILQKLRWYFWTLHGVLIPLFSGGLSTLWALGFVGSLGFTLNPLMAVVFLLLSARVILSFLIPPPRVPKVGRCLTAKTSTRITRMLILMGHSRVYSLAAAGLILALLIGISYWGQRTIGDISVGQALFSTDHPYNVTPDRILEKGFVGITDLTVIASVHLSSSAGKGVVKVFLLPKQAGAEKSRTSHLPQLMHG